MREKSGFPSHGRINDAMDSVYTPVHALINDTWRCNVFEKRNLSDVTSSVVVLKSTENSS